MARHDLEERGRRWIGGGKLARTAALAGGLAAAIVAGALVAGSTGGTAASGPKRVGDAPSFTALECGTYSGKGCAPASQRVDLTRPTFTNPTKVTNPLFPISELNSAVLLGKVEGEPFRAETTLLPGTTTVVWAGQRIKTLVSQYMAYRGGRIEEVAIDRYAEADDGSVWYLGEDVVDYRAGSIFTTAGTWLAGREGPAAMIMPGNPRVGDVFRPENILGVVFEEVRVKEIGKTVRGPRGPISGAIVAEELHLDGSHSAKVFAPGRGEFSTGSGGDTEILALGVPADAMAIPEPAQLASILTAAVGLVGAVQGRDWEAANPIARRIRTLAASLPKHGQPPLVTARLAAGVNGLARSVKSRKVARAGTSAILAGESILDLQLQYRPVSEIDRGRFELWAYRVLIDATARNRGGVSGDVAAMEWIRDRFAHTLEPAERTELDTRLLALRIAADAGRLAAAGDHAIRLAARLRSLGIR